MTPPSIALFSVFREMSDPRIDRHKKFDLFESIIISVLAIIAGADDWVSIHDFGIAKEAWLRTFLDLKNGIPSHDTFRRIFMLIDRNKFSSVFSDWSTAYLLTRPSQTIAIDGKTIRGSASNAKHLAALHIVSAWSVDNQITLGQLCTHEKSNEITAIPELLDAIDVRGAVVTIDAMGCQKEIAAQIVHQGGDFVLGLKGNQGTLFSDVSLSFEGADPAIISARVGVPYTTVDGDHGRIETRNYWVNSDLTAFDLSEWEGVKGIGIVDRQTENKATGEISSERSFFLLSSSYDPSKFAQHIRGHWSVENNLHWQLDVSFGEDKSAVRDRNASHNLTTIRKISLALLKRAVPKHKVGIKNRRLKAGWDNKYLAQVMAEIANFPFVKEC